MTETVKKDSRIRLTYRLSMSDGDVLDETDSGGSTIQLGQGEFSEALEALLVGMHAGEQRNFSISAQDRIFGEWDPANIQLLDLSAMGSETALEAGQVVEFDTPEGPVAALVHEVDDETVTVDFNHPLCQHDLMFDVEILEITN